MKRCLADERGPPGPDVQFTSVDDAGEFKQDGEPASHPDAVARGDIHVIACVLS